MRLASRSVLTLASGLFLAGGAVAPVDGSGPEGRIAKVPESSPIESAVTRESSGNVVIGVNSRNALRLRMNGGMGTTRDAGALPAADSHGTGTGSDARFKTNVEVVEDGLETVARLRPVRFDWKRSEFPAREFADGRQVGLIAQDVLSVMPELVTKGDDGFYSVDYGRLTPVLVAAIQEQQELIRAQKRQLQSQADRIDALAQAVAAMRADRADVETSLAAR